MTARYTVLEMRSIVFCLAFVIHGVLSVYLTNTTNYKVDNNPAYWTESDIWGPMLEEYVLTSHREKRVLKIPISEDLVDKPTRKSDNITEPVEKEGKISPGKPLKYDSPVVKPQTYEVGPGKITNNNGKPPMRQVSETDLYLLGAIEKLAYRVDFMEKRLRRVEEMMYYMMAGNRIDKEQCPNNFSRAGTNCYLFHSNAGREMDWKAASKYCKKIGANLAEMETIEENQDIVAFIQSTPYLKGKDFWTGGLNPGLLWIWSNSARPVPTKNQNKKKPGADIPGEGRCLKLAYDPALRSYNYKGSDCGMRYSFICELPENTSSNEIRRIGRTKKIFDEL